MRSRGRHRTAAGRAAWLGAVGAIALGLLAVPAAGGDEEARRSLERALAEDEQRLGSRSFGLIAALQRLSDYHFDAGAWAEAEAVDRRILAIRLAQQGTDHVDVAVARKNLALDLYRQGRYAEQEAELLEAARRLEGHQPAAARELADALGYLAEAVRAQGRYREVEPLFRQALALGPTSRSTLLSNFAGFYRDQNRYAEARWRLSQALALEEAADPPDRVELVAVWNNMAELYRFQGDEREAERYYVKAVTTAREVFPPQHPRLGTMVNQMAELYREEGRLAEAEPLYREALTIKKGALGDVHPDVAHTHDGLGRLLATVGRPAEAETHLRRSLEIRTMHLGPSHPDTAEARLALAELLLGQPDRTGEAAGLLDASITALGRTTASARVRARALSIRAGRRREAGDAVGARHDLSNALDLVERLRPEAGGGEQTRARFVARHSADFARLARWLVEDGEVASAFVVVERGRSRALLDQLAAAHVDLLDGVAPDERDALQRREATLLGRLAWERQQVSSLETRRAWDEAALARQRLAAVEAEYERLYEDVRNASVRWRGFSTNRVADVPAAQRAVPPGGLLLSYLIDDTQALVFVVPPPGNPVAVLRLTVPEEAARVLGVAPGDLTAPKLQRVLAAETLDPQAPDGLLARLGRVPAGSGARPALVRSLGALFRVLVPAPLWSRARSSREVVVVPDHLLHRLPFEALVVQSAPEGPRFWLDEGPPVRYAASATTLLTLAERRETSARTGIVSVANPEWHGPGSVAPSLEPLPGSAREAEEVRAAWTREGRAADLTSIEGAEAREPRVRSALPGARHIHLATHGLVDDTRGELFASLALSPPADPGPEDDGLLQLHEILRLPLDAELAVLSACESRVGKVVAGEGVFALSRAFLIAGSRRVIASLWPVADEASAGLVARVFEGLARAERTGAPLDHAANLALAKRQVRSQPGLADPFFWAPFVLEGAR